MTCRARRRGQARGRDKLDWLVPSFSPRFSIIPHLARLSSRLPLISTARLWPPVADLPARVLSLFV